jgi:hypothetical protein
LPSSNSIPQGRRDHNQIECLLADEKPGVDTPCGQDVEKNPPTKRGDREIALVLS